MFPKIWLNTTQNVPLEHFKMFLNIQCFGKKCSKNVPRFWGFKKCSNIGQRVFRGARFVKCSIIQWKKYKLSDSAITIQKKVYEHQNNTLNEHVEKCFHLRL